MALSAILAALLLEQPSHGYQLKATLEDELGPLWTTSASQIYLTLGRMQRDGLVTSRRVRQQSLPDRQLLSLTDRGRDVAHQWLFESDDPDENVVRVMVARLVVPDRFGEVVDIIIEQRSVALAELRQLRSNADGGFQREASDAEIQRTQADLRWAASVRERADAIVARPRPARPISRLSRYA